MVQMGDSVAVERCVQHLNNIPVGNGGKIQIAFSKQNFLSEVINPFLLPDHTPSFKEYTGSKNNRFLSPAQASKNRIQPPSKVRASEMENKIFEEKLKISKYKKVREKFIKNFH